MTHRRAAAMAVLVAALGYFVDIYDLILFGVVRVPSLQDLGVPQERLLDEGLHLQSVQMWGLLVGGLLWGVIADKKGRLSVLFASIITYSLANIANGLVTDLTQYAIARFVAGVGLAGELGAGITLVSELMEKKARGWGTTLVATVGICGGVVAGLIGGEVHWRTAYFIGGGLGIALLVLRIGVVESGMFGALRGRDDVKRGDFLHLFRDRRRALRYLAVIAVGVPIWYAVGILITASRELGAELGVAPVPNPARAFLWCYAGLALGDLASGALSQALESRRKALAIFLVLTVGAIAFYFTVGGRSQTSFYAACTVLGFATGYWAVFVTSASEQFGTNLRGTVSTTAPNFVRGSVPLMTWAYKGLIPSLGLVGAAIAVGAGALALAFVALIALHETFGKDLDYLEP
jgi:MFS transporter, putative metabolite:H+ symporter